MLERIMYNWLFNYLRNEKQYGFQKELFTEHAILQLIDQTNNSF